MGSVEFIPDEDDGGWIAACDIPGMIGEGETVLEAACDLIALLVWNVQILEEGRP